MKVALSLPNATPQAGELALEVQGDIRGFQAAGHDVTVYYETDLPTLAGETEEYDLIVLPYLDKTIQTGDTHLHHQIGHFGPQDLDPRLIANTFAKADTVSVTDPAVPEKAPWFQLLEASTADVAMVPSPPPMDLFPAQDPGDSDGTALIPNLGAEYAPDRRCAAIVRHTPMVTYRAHATALDHTLPTNVHRYPPVPVASMPSKYARAEVVFNPAQAEPLSSPCYRAFCSGRAQVSANEAIGALQTLPASVVEPDAFGSTVAWWQDTYQASFFEGSHYFSSTTDDLQDVLTMVMEDRELRREVATRGREWVDTVFGEWGWQEKAETLVALSDDQ
jgi:hypothetical protein